MKKYRKVDVVGTVTSTCDRDRYVITNVHVQDLSTS